MSFVPLPMVKSYGQNHKTIPGGTGFSPCLAVLKIRLIRGENQVSSLSLPLSFSPFLPPSHSFSYLIPLSLSLPPCLPASLPPPPSPFLLSLPPPLARSLARNITRSLPARLPSSFPRSLPPSLPPSSPPPSLLGESANRLERKDRRLCGSRPQNLHMLPGRPGLVQPLDCSAGG